MDMIFIQELAPYFYEGISLRKININAKYYRLSITAHIECFVLIERK